MDHGTRQCYRSGCRHTACRAANAQYQARRRHQHAKGQIPLRARIPAGPTWKMIEALKVEGLNYGQIALRLGLRWPTLQLHTDSVTLANYLKIRKIYQSMQGEA